MNYEAGINPDLAAPVGAPAGARGGDGIGGAGRAKWLVAAVLLALAALIGWKLTHRTAAGADADKKAAAAQTVTVIAPGRRAVPRTITASGTLAARRMLPVGVAGEGGRVVAVLVDAGSWVHAGQVLATVDRSVQSQQIAGQAANIDVARANARLAQDNLDRALKLVSKGFISRADVDRLTATRDGAVAQVRVAEAQLGQLRASAARLNILAPAEGLVLSRGVEPGQVVGAGSGVLFQIAKGGEMEMQARVAETDLAQLGVGVPVDVVPVGTSRAFTGQVWQLAPTIDPQTRQGMARVALRFDPALRPGGFATATIRAGMVTAPVLPESAVLHDAKGSYVYVVDGNNKAVRRAVKIGEVAEEGIVIAEGLAGTEHVVLRAGGFLNPGDVVRPVLTRADAASAG